MFVCSLFLFAASMSAAPMVRVIAVKDSHTIVVDDRGVAAEVKLAQVVVAPDDEAAATSYLRQSLANAWVMIETDSTGASFVYRSPDALFINGELSRRAFASAGPRMTYLGESMPGPKREEKSVAPRTPAPRVIASAPRPRRTRRR